MIAVGLIQVLILLVALLRAKALAVMLGPEGVGVIGTVDQIVVTLTQISALGIPFTAMKFMSAAHSESDAAFRAVFAAFARVTILLALAAMVISIAATQFFPDLFHGLAEYETAVLIALFSVPPTLVTILVAHTLASARRPATAGLYNLVFAGGVALAAITGAYLDGIRGFYIGASAAGIAIVLGAFVWLRLHLGLSLLQRSLTLRGIIAQNPLVIRTAFAAYVALVAFAATMLIVRYAVISSRGEVDTGYLQAAIALALSVGSILSMMNALHLAPSMNRNDPPEVKVRRAVRFANRVALLLIAGAVPVALLPGLTLTILFTGAFVPAATVLIVMLIWQAHYQLMTAFHQLMVGINHLIFAALASMISLLVSAGLVFLTVDRLGILAAPISLIAGSVVATVAMLARLKRSAAVPIPWAMLGRFAFVSIAIFGAEVLFDSITVLPDPVGIGLRLGYWLSALAAMWLTMPTDMELRSVLTNLRH